MAKIIINNSFSELVGFSDDAMLAVKNKLTYKDKELEYQKMNLIKSAEKAKYSGNKKLEGYYRIQLKKLPSAIVCLLKGNSFPTGLLERVKTALVEAKTGLYEEIDGRVVPKVRNRINWRNKPPKNRYYQDEAINMALEKERGVLQLGVGSGKTLIFTHIIKQLEVNTLVITPSLALTQQNYNTLEMYFGPTKVKIYNSATVKKTSKFAPIRIMNMQSIAALQKSGDLTKFLADIDMVIVDEVHHCFSGKEKVYTDKGYKTIEDIVNNKLKVKALSYNEETGLTEYKPIVNYWTHEAPAEMVEIELENGKIIKCTKDHKIYTKNRGYVKACKLKLTDDVIISSWNVCPICDKRFKSNPGMTGHMTSHYIPMEKKIKHALAMVKHPNHNNKNARRLNSLSKMGDKNVSKRPEVRKKISKRMKKWFHSLSKEKQLEQITRFQNAPKHGVKKGPTSLEKRIIDLNIKEVRFTGNGKLWLSSNKKRLNPDFKVKNKRKVIETGDIEYWHNKEDVENRIKLLNKIDFKCLYLTSDIMKELSNEELTYWLKDFING